MGGLVNFQLSCQLYRQFHGQVKVLTLSLLLTVTVTVTKHWVKYNEQHSILHVFFLFPFIEFHYEESSASRGMFSYCVKPILQEDKLAIKYLLTNPPPPLSCPPTTSTIHLALWPPIKRAHFLPGCHHFIQKYTEQPFSELFIKEVIALLSF